MNLFSRQKSVTLFYALLFLSFTSVLKAQDADSDGIDDSYDNCPSIANPNQEDSDFNEERVNIVVFERVTGMYETFETKQTPINCLPAKLSAVFRMTTDSGHHEIHKSSVI
jgi:hypothetical protein